MSALKTPADDAPAEEWGALAESIPGWKEPDGLLASFVPMIEVGSPIGDLPSPRYVVDPDHWAWEGWMLRLLGAGVFAVWMAQNWREGDDERIGRACIRIAAALGRWPGGDS